MEERRRLFLPLPLWLPPLVALLLMVASWSARTSSSRTSESEILGCVVWGSRISTNLEGMPCISVGCGCGPWCTVCCMVYFFIGCVGMYGCQLVAPAEDSLMRSMDGRWTSYGLTTTTIAIDDTVN